MLVYKGYETWLYPVGVCGRKAGVGHPLFEVGTAEVGEFASMTLVVWYPTEAHKLIEVATLYAKKLARFGGGIDFL